MKKIIITIAVISTLAGSFAHGEEKRPDSALTINGYAEAYYSYDFNKPIDNIKPSFIYS